MKFRNSVYEEQELSGRLNLQQMLAAIKPESQVIFDERESSQNPYRFWVLLIALSSLLHLMIFKLVYPYTLPRSAAQAENQAQDTKIDIVLVAKSGVATDHVEKIKVEDVALHKTTLVKTTLVKTTENKAADTRKIETTRPEVSKDVQQSQKNKIEGVFIESQTSASKVDAQVSNESIFSPRLRQQFHNASPGQQREKVAPATQLNGSVYYHLGDGECLREASAAYGITERDSEAFLLYNVRKVACPGVNNESEGDAMVRGLRASLSKTKN